MRVSPNWSYQKSSKSTILPPHSSRVIQLSDTNLKFSSVNIPNITLREYFARISMYSECSQACYIIALIYLDRAMMAHPQLIINSYCVHRYVAK